MSTIFRSSASSDKRKDRTNEENTFRAIGFCFDRDLDRVFRNGFGDRTDEAARADNNTHCIDNDRRNTLRASDVDGAKHADNNAHCIDNDRRNTLRASDVDKAKRLYAE